MKRRLEPLSTFVDLERLRMRHDYDPAPISDASRLIVRDRTDEEPGVVVVHADTDNDFREYHLGPSEIQEVVSARTAQPRQAG